MFDKNGLLPKLVTYGVCGVALLIVVTLTIQLQVGYLTFDRFPAAITFAYISNVLVLPVLVIGASRSRHFLLPALVWLHFSMAVMLTYFIQVYSPFTAAWAILILLASVYYQWKGFWLSSFVLAILFVLNIFFLQQNTDDGSIVATSLLAGAVVLLTVLTSYMFVTIIVGSQRKTNDLLRAQRSELLQVTRLNTLLNSISDTVLTLNRYGRITSQNAAAQGFFDTNRSLIGRDVDKLLQLTDADDEPVSIRALIDSVKSTSLRDDLSDNNAGEIRHLSIQIARIRGTFGDNEEYGTVLIIRDITKQKTLEEEKDEFISVTSHELRTPVAIAEGSLSNFLLMQDKGASREKMVAVAEEAHRQIIYLANMINDLSTLSRAERGIGSDIEPIKISELLHNLYLKYEPEAKEKSLQLNLDGDHHLPDIETSRLYLEEIMQNFITNAIKYTKQGSITFGAKLESEGWIKFYVKDTGIGINKADLQRIFEKFYRSEDYRTRETNGTGLGLYVVEKLADKLGTKIAVESRFNVGSTFSFVLPVRASGAASVENTDINTENIPVEAPEESGQVPAAE